jgi:hypothetical protein
MPVLERKLSRRHPRQTSKVGAKYHLRPTKRTILLQQSKPYRMRNPTHQAEFFTLLASLFNYMVSGKSHIGFLSNNLGNIYAQEPVCMSCSMLIPGKGDI